MKYSILSAAALACAIATCAPLPVAADVEAGETSIAVSASAGVGVPSGSAGAPTVTDCANEALGLAGLHGGIEAWLGVDLDISSSGPVAFRRCTSIATGGEVAWVTGLEQPVPLTDWVVATARSQLAVDVPEIATSPPRGGTQLVGIPVWFWLADRDPVGTTATIPGLAATLTATPSTTTITITGPDGGTTTLDCAENGRPWQQGRDDPRARSDCSHAFTTNGAFTIDATTTWALAWTATNGQAGTLPAIERTTTFTLTIQEGQSVTD